MYSRRSLAALLLALLGIAGPAAATSVTSTSYSGWLTTVTGGASVDIFGNVTNNQSYDTSSGVSLSNSSYPSSTFVFTGPDTAYQSGWNLTTRAYQGINSLYGPTDGVGNITVTMPSGGENAIMLSLATTGNSTITLKLSDGETFTPSAGIFGVSISHDISWLTLSTTNGSAVIIDDFRYGNSNLTQDPAPSLEASTVLMIGGGLLVMLGGRRKLFS